MKYRIFLHLEPDFNRIMFVDKKGEAETDTYFIKETGACILLQDSFEKL
jgi:hypothetical protein